MLVATNMPTLGGEREGAIKIDCKVPHLPKGQLEMLWPRLGKWEEE